jgi:hypothetical protein
MNPRGSAVSKGKPGSNLNPLSNRPAMGMNMKSRMNRGGRRGRDRQWVDINDES